MHPMFRELFIDTDAADGRAQPRTGTMARRTGYNRCNGPSSRLRPPRPGPR